MNFNMPEKERACAVKLNLNQVDIVKAPKFGEMFQVGKFVLRAKDLRGAL